MWICLPTNSGLDLPFLVTRRLATAGPNTLIKHTCEKSSRGGKGPGAMRMYGDHGMTEGDVVDFVNGEVDEDYATNF